MPAARPRPARKVARVTRKPQRASRVALAMAGGGPLGAIYEIGALTALSEALDGVDFNDLDIYVGVSAGGIIGAGLANGITPAAMCRMFIETDERTEERFDPAILMQPAFGEFRERARRFPGLLGEAVWQALFSRPGEGVIDALQKLTRAIPTGVFSNQGLYEYLTALLERPGRHNDFRALKSSLYLVATDLDTGESVEFGSKGHDHVPISLAATASSALPGMFPPVEINGRHYVDGALKRTLHASIALKEGADLVLCLNPIVPFDDSAAAKRYGALVEGGLPVVLAQTIRSVIHSRMQIGMRQYADDFKGADVVLIEPSKSDTDMFFTNAFSYASRRRLCEHAYQKTRADLLARRHELGPKLARHGITLNIEVLKDKSLTLVKAERRKAPKKPVALSGGTTLLKESLEDLARYVKVATAKQAATRKAPLSRGR